MHSKPMIETDSTKPEKVVVRFSTQTLNGSLESSL